MTFKFEHKGKKYSIPAFKDIPMGALRKSRAGGDNDLDRAFIILEQVLGLDSKELDAIDSMDASELNDFITSWTQGAGVGESQSSES